MAKNNSKNLQRELFLTTVRTVLSSIPKYAENETAYEDRLAEILSFRNNLIIQMSSGVNNAFVGRLNSDTIASNIYKTACNITFAVLLEELPPRDKITNLQEKFEDE